jgi:hypothetical protein
MSWRPMLLVWRNTVLFLFAALLLACSARAGEKLESWPRPRWEPGGGKALLFFLVYGDTDPKATLLASQYRTAGVPPGFRVVQAARTADSCAAFLDAEFWNDFKQREPELAGAIGKSAKCTVFRGEIEDSKNLDYLRDVIGLVTYTLDHGGIAAYDPLTFRWWTAAEWKAKVFDAKASAVAGQVQHYGSTDEAHPGTFWHYTHGLRKFGRPDLSVHGASAENQETIGAVFKRLGEWEIEGKVFHDGQTLQGPDLPQGLAVHLRGSMDDVDFNNVHWEIDWPGLGR